MEKKKQKMPLFVPILWFITTLFWTVNFALRLSSPYRDETGLVLTALAALASLFAALMNLWRYKRDKKETD